ncbi:hypothetical protein PSN45_004382 [Yamadazyma tenuis]|uniref:Uncharacterized protein n=1 Tax=Candida tenuis (strain ATCC 10573 / BCRC 21748 / CBS 615 / JCM 9827 / NBRC 10315 / NRRL Y-1498 / VKM Y-70) TaxID=590646 RepID=G3B5Z6_CANTC|nr:uncharacterized protein CANTEDRAFT_94106 [Yamadazyma tenuis ATCC 10573]EGV63340.1 hypothetical protein CANTEDRAFT_94106 [Yamadazyma tenuis ATCC 10573]WEJ96838.1 hypothetical protein PSN45_004382 [Yamadazyma tenuis]
MNVTDRGYYTSTYLDTVNRPKGGRRIPSDSRSKRADISQGEPPIPHSQPAPRIPQTAVMPSPSTAMSNFEGPNVMPLSPEETQFTGFNDSVDTQPVAFDPDQLHEELTPAQLNVLQRQGPPAHRRRRRRPRSYYEDDGYDDDDSYYNDSAYHDYYYQDHRVRVPQAGARRPRQQKSSFSKKKGDDYYIAQKKRYDEAEFYKPKNYTHKTFRDVFTDADEESQKYNPMEFVFDDPEKLREQEQNQKIKKAFKTIQMRLGKDDYANYDYYDNKKTSTVTNDIFVTNNDSDGSDDEENKLEDIIGEGEEGRDAKERAKKKRNLKKLWKSTTKNLKKELGRDYFNNMEKQWVLEEEAKKRKDIEQIAKAQAAQELLDQSVNEPIITEPDDHTKSGANFYAGPKPDFHPMWNYILSWVAYQQPAVPDATGKAQATAAASLKQIEEPPHTEVKTLIKPAKPKSQPKSKPAKKGNNPDRIKVTKEQFKNFNKNMSKLKNMWNLPASNIFVGEAGGGNDGGSMKYIQMDSATFNESLPQSSAFNMPFDGNSQEFVIELEGDEQTMAEELYFNPQTGQLERQPPTSFSSLEFSERSLNKGSNFANNRALIDTTRGATTIISNINSLIKSIKLMKIIFAPIDVIAESFPNLQTVVIMVELIIFMWILYELSLLIDALCMMVKAVCAPMIAMGRFMNRIM